MAWHEPFFPNTDAEISDPGNRCAHPTLSTYASPRSLSFLTS
jgi:hypothetical protein